MGTWWRFPVHFVLRGHQGGVTVPGTPGQVGCVDFLQDAFGLSLYFYSFCCADRELGHHYALLQAKGTSQNSRATQYTRPQLIQTELGQPANCSPDQTKSPFPLKQSARGLCMEPVPNMKHSSFLHHTSSYLFPHLPCSKSYSLSHCTICSITNNVKNNSPVSSVAEQEHRDWGVPRSPGSGREGL